MCIDHIPYHTELVFKGEIPMCTRAGCAVLPPAENDTYHGLVKPGWFEVHNEFAYIDFFFVCVPNYNNRHRVLW